MNKIIVWGTALSATAVMLGAMGAHALKPVLSSEQLSSFETGVRYQMYHGLALILFSLVKEKSTGKLINYVAPLFITGTLFFSVSVYLLATRGITGMEGLKAMGPITPVGGVLLISGWVCWMLSFIKMKD